ncbi:MAG TPA: MerR family transcriptional regulator [Actinomycetota bacterium]|nr:MerR family transcriptional regulator [Actinomycetota bacterium]
MSIGEVLSVLKSEFPDISVSKIRFLESEGLIAPERTASGYRKFVKADLDRLRFILKLQRDSFLPLKVIRERLAAADASPEGVLAGASQASRAPQSKAETPSPAPAAAAPAPEPEEDLTQAPAPVQMTESDLADATGVDLKQIEALRDFGVICKHTRNGSAYFDADDLSITRLAGEFLKLGIEPRHLKTLRRFAEQEAALFEQVVTPALRNRRPDAREQAAGTLTELAKLSRALRQTYLRQSLRSTLTGER